MFDLVPIEDVIKDIATNKLIYTIFLICIYILIYKLVILIVGIAIKFNKRLKTTSSNRKQKTIYILSKSIIKYVVIGIVFITLLDFYGVNTEKIIAGLGIAGLVVGFAFQDILKDFLAGIFIIIDDHYSVGDTIEVNGFKGEVLSLGLKTTKLKTGNGEICSLSNRNIVEVINYSTSSSLAIVDIPVPYSENEQKVTAVINKLLPEIESISEIKGNAEFLGIENFIDTSMVFRITAECAPLKQSIVRRKIMQIIKNGFDENQINLNNLGVDRNKSTKISTK